jgi:hypothetical protein
VRRYGTRACSRFGRENQDGEWRVPEMCRGYRAIESLRRKAEKDADARRKKIAAECKLRVARRKKTEEYIELHKKLKDLFVRTEPLGMDKGFNSFFLFAGDGDRIYCEIRDETSLDQGEWKVFTSDQIYGLYASLDERDVREKKLRTNLERHFLEIIDHGRIADEVFDVWHLSPKQVEEGWKTRGNEFIGRRVRRIYSTTAEADGRIMAYLPANPTDGDPEFWYMVHDDLEGHGEDLEKFELDVALNNVVNNVHVKRVDLDSSWEKVGPSWIGRYVVMDIGGKGGKKRSVANGEVFGYRKNSDSNENEWLVRFNAQIQRRNSKHGNASHFFRVHSDSDLRDGFMAYDARHEYRDYRNTLNHNYSSMFKAQLGLGGVNDALLNLEYGSVEKMTRAGSPWKTAYHGQKRFKERVSSAAKHSELIEPLLSIEESHSCFGLELKLYFI